MKTPRHDIANAISRRVGKVGAKKLAQEVAAYVLAEGRTKELDSLLRDVMQERAEAGIVEAVAVSARPLTNTIRENIRRQLKQAYPKAEQIIISERQDPSVIGGVKIELANEQLDLSLQAKLNKFKQLTIA